MFIWPKFQRESELRGCKSDKGHVEGPERKPQGRGQGVIHLFSNIHVICTLYTMYMIICQFFKGNQNFEVAIGQRPY